jgi:hypothetical protein
MGLTAKNAYAIQARELQIVESEKFRMITLQLYHLKFHKKIQTEMTIQVRLSNSN